jgi:hypothetical protein
MKRILLTLALGAAARADLTPDQKEFDIRVLAAHYAKHYAPYEWKIEAFKFDLYDLNSWIARVRASKDDLEFFEICAEYVTSLRDTHSSFIVPTVFSASLGFTVDLYDGVPLIDSITRSQLPAARFPFDRGWEVVSIDGEPAQALIGRFGRFVSMANDRSRRRTATSYLSFRPQSRIPRAHEIGESAEVVLRNPQGEESAFTIPWRKIGTPVTSAGKLPSPVIPRAASQADLGGHRESLLPDYLVPLAELANERVDLAADVLGVGARNPVWALPAGFQVRLGRLTTDFFFSGTYVADGLRIGLIRIPNFSPSSTVAALRQFETEIAFMQENTDGLIVDITHNNGGDACYNEEIQRRLIPYEFRGMGREIRVTTRFLRSFSAALQAARAAEAEPHVIALLEARLEEFRRAFTENRARTGPLPICSETLIRQPAAVVYTKPQMTLVDDFSISAADGFAAVLQDAHRGPLFGWRTNGAGGTTGGFPATVYSEAFATHTIAMHHRRAPVATPDFPTASYVENIGVRPDREYDSMTRENLLNDYRPFVAAFTAAMLDHIRASR